MGLKLFQVKLERKFFVDSETGHLQSELERVVLKPPELGWVPHYGYNSLFPFLMNLLPLVSRISMDATVDLSLREICQHYFPIDFKVQSFQWFFFWVGDDFLHLWLIAMFVQNSSVLESQLELLKDESNLWTTYGLRSLATTRYCLPWICPDPDMEITLKSIIYHICVIWFFSVIDTLQFTQAATSPGLFVIFVTF